MKPAKSPAILSASAATLLGDRIFAFPGLQRASRWAGAAALALLLGSGVDTASATDYTWTGATNQFWATTTNWAPPSPPGGPGNLAITDNLFFGAPLNTNTVNNAALPAYNSITFTAGSSSFVLGGSLIDIDAGGFTNNSSKLQTLAFADTFGTPGIQLTNFNGNTQVWNAAAGDILVKSNVGFTAGITLIITGSHNTTITGVISDLGAAVSTVVKSGTGILRLTAKNTYAGDTIVNGGTLLVDGAIASARTLVNAGGTLGGIGYIGGLVINSGNVAPGDSPGTLTIAKNYTQTPDGTLTIEIAGKKSGQHDLLAVGGQANLDGTLRLVRVGKGPRLKFGDKVTIVTAQAGVEGEFSKVDARSFSGTLIKPKVVYHSTSVVVEAGQGSFSDFADREGMTFNQRAVAKGLDKLAFHNNAAKLLRYLDSRPLPELASDFDKIAPDELASVFNIGVALSILQGENQQRRNADVRAGSHGFSAAGFHTAGSGPNYSGTFGVAGPTGNDGKDSKKEFVPPEENRWGVFLTGVGEWVDVSGDGNARGYDITTGGFTLGADYKLTPNLAVGISAGYAGTGVDLTNNGRVFVNGGKLGLYGTYFEGGFYVDAAVNGGYNSYDTRRSGLQGDARGSTDGGELSTLFGVGYDWKVGALTIGPTMNFQYTYVGIDGYTEHGSLAPLNIRSQGGESVRTALGFKATYDWKIGGVLVKPELRAAWQHEYGDAGFDVDAGFAGASNSGFTVRGPEIGRDSLLLGAGVAVLWNERTATYVYYDGDLARERYESHSVSGGVRLSF